MKSMLRALVLTSAAFCATAAFAADKAVVNVPFNFETQGIAFPAGQYSAELIMGKNVLTLRNVQNPGESILWTVSPADAGDISKALLMEFNDLGATHQLRSIQLGSRITTRLDAPAKRHDAGSVMTAVSGQ
jgi:hypothetical protein